MYVHSSGASNQITSTNMAAFQKSDMFSPAPFWHNGPAPGAIYNFPGRLINAEFGGIQRSQ